MKVMVAVKATKQSEAGEMPSEELLLAMGKYNEELVKAGIMLDGAGLHPSSKGVRIRFSGNNRAVLNGPFAETKELIAGYWVWKVSSLQEAIDWAKKCPNPHPETGESFLEIRPYFEIEDFGKAYTEEVQDQEDRIKSSIARNATKVEPYLFFGGRCDEAIEFYKSAVDARLERILRFNESPEPMPEGMLMPGFEKKIMHASMIVGNSRVMLSDGCDDMSKKEGFRLTLSVPTEEDAHRVYNALAKGGKAEMPLTKTFWSPCYGMVSDKFGVGWIVIVPSPAQGC